MGLNLLCTFSHASDHKLTTDYIFQNYELDRNCVFIFENADNPRDYIITYNVSDVDHFIENTILIHRKKDTNTLYTINALNQIIIRANNGVLDKKFIIDWDCYVNALLLFVDQDITVIPLKLKSVIRRK